MVEQAAAQVGVALTGQTDLKGGYEVGHGAQIIGFGPGGVSVVWVPGTPVADMRSTSPASLGCMNGASETPPRRAAGPVPGAAEQHGGVDPAALAKAVNDASAG